MSKIIAEIAKQFTDELFAGDDLTDFDTQTEKNDAYVMCMAFGNHLMEQPLASRMTEEEKERVRKIYVAARDGYWDECNDMNIAVESVLEDIFGAELFEEE